MPQQPITWDSQVTWDDPNLTWDGFMPETSSNTVMSDDNRISATMTAQDLTDILAAIQTIRDKMPFLISISDQERQEIAKMGPKSQGFDQNCAAYMASNPEFIPGFIDIAEINKDRALRDQLLNVSSQLSTLNDQVGDTLLVANSEIWMADLAYYQNTREAKRRSRAGAEVIYNDLRERFPGAPKKTTTPTPA